jgi:hypothetical protein
MLMSSLSTGVAIGAGSALAAWVGYACYVMTGNIQWRLPLALQMVCPAVLVLGIYTIPESPRWRKLLLWPPFTENWLTFTSPSAG